MTRPQPLIRNVDVAFAAANLLNIGYQPDDALLIASKWRELQNSRTFNRIESYADSTPYVNKEKSFKSGRLYVSFHYSSYAHLYREIALSSRDKTIFGLIGAHSLAHQSALCDKAKEFGFTLRFVSSGSKMIKEMRKALCHGYSGVILIDVPWSSRNTALDVRVSTSFGEFKTLSSLLRLIVMIDPDYQIAYVYGDAGTLVLDCIGHASFEQTFQALGDLITRGPADYERLHQLHRFCVLPQSHRRMVSFVEAGLPFAVEASSMRIYRNPGRHLNLDTPNGEEIAIGSMV